MSLKKSVAEVMDRPMDRKQFLAHTGSAVLALVGVSSVLKAFSLQDGKGKQASGYGRGAYGR